MLVRPVTTTWLISLTPRASFTSGPTTQKGPISTSSASSAPGSTIAVGCTLELGIIRIQNHGADLGFGDHLPVHFGFAIKPPGAAAAANLAHMVVKMVAGQHGLAKLGAVYPHEIDELRLVIGLEIRHAQRPRRLRQSLDDQHARHDRETRKMPLKEGFVDGDALDADAAFIAIHFDQAVDQQKRVAMRQQFHDPRNVGAAQFLLGRLRFTHDPARTIPRASTIAYSSRRRGRRPSRFRAAICRAHSAMGTAGVLPMRAPAGTSSLACPPPAICAPEPTLMWPTAPDWPPITKIGRASCRESV